jgi:hypothetical protein
MPHYCKELPNKDHATCRKRFIGSTDCWAVSQVQSAAAWLEWVVSFIGGATPQGGRVFQVPDYL